MKKFLLAFVVIIASAGYVAYQYLGGGSASATTPVATTDQTTQTPVTTPDPTPTPTPTPTPVSQGQFTDGTYTGAAANAFYGTIQVQAVIQNGKLASVTFLQYPNANSTSRQINGQAMPQLMSEAVAAQSATVSGVSGATQTSEAFVQSLGDALSQAKNS